MTTGFYFDNMTPARTLHNVRKVGRYDWLGGYNHAVLLDDGEIIGPECVAPNYREISWSTRHDANDGWQAVAVVALDGSFSQDSDLHCAHCNKVLEESVK